MDGSGVSQRNNVVAWAILGYLCSHPEAKDTALGIGKWWLRTEGITADMDRVQIALEYLARSGWLTEMESHSGQMIYGLNKERQDALQRFLESQSTYH
jgi:hypothetical protein